MTIPTETEDIAAASAALAAEKVDADEVRSFVLMYRALEATRPAQSDFPVLLSGFTLQSTEPMDPDALKEQLERMRARIDELLAG